MSTVAKAAAQGPSKLSKILQHLKAKPQLNLTGVKSLKLSYAFRNDHFGARHFAKEDLPRLRWANPSIDIQVERIPKTVEQEWRPELAIQFENGKSTTLNLENKFSKTILRAVMDAAGGKAWEEHKAAALLAGQPILPGEELEAHPHFLESQQGRRRPRKST
ncbi:hypothetical protein FA13DRAFT_1698251 [Coprinellus micaceus]|uniref:Uncharacterized protein n=1 Tax=Coprinellus micaceus TaxID=71717 RepID=A0A4Y7SBC9_COPMI|nr:hypothetical protein FA13DRAFT_1698251 [Coprinellus micaceus]